MNPKESKGKSMQVVAIHRTKPVGDRPPTIVRVCKDPNDAIPVAEYIVTEMKKNPFTPEGKKITSANLFDPAPEIEKWNAQPWHAKMGGMPDFYGYATGQKLAAYKMWAAQVGPGRAWDLRKPSVMRNVTSEKRKDGQSCSDIPKMAHGPIAQTMYKITFQYSWGSTFTLRPNRIRCRPNSC